MCKEGDWMEGIVNFNTPKARRNNFSMAKQLSNLMGWDLETGCSVPSGFQVTREMIALANLNIIFESLPVGNGMLTLNDRRDIHSLFLLSRAGHQALNITFLTLPQMKWVFRSLHLSHQTFPPLYSWYTSTLNSLLRLHNRGGGLSRSSLLALWEFCSLGDTSILSEVDVEGAEQLSACTNLGAPLKELTGSPT